MTSYPPPVPGVPNDGEVPDQPVFQAEAEFTYGEVPTDQAAYTYDQSVAATEQGTYTYDQATYTTDQGTYTYGEVQYAEPQAQATYGEPQVGAVPPVAPQPTQPSPAAAQVYVQPAQVVVQNYPQGAARPAQLATNRSLTKFILLGIITLGIYSVWQTARSGDDLNLMASKWDGKRSMSYWLIFFLLGPITLQIMSLVWWNGFAARIGNEQVRRGLPKTVSASDFWLWGILGSIIIVGPFIFAHKWLHAMNSLCANYNEFG